MMKQFIVLTAILCAVAGGANAQNDSPADSTNGAAATNGRSEGLPAAPSSRSGGVGNAATNAVVTPTNSPAGTNVATGQTLAATNVAAVVADPNDAQDTQPTNAVRMNFHNAPINTVLNYLSKRMGFVVVSEVDVRGTTTIVSEQPVNASEVVQMLSAALAKNSYNVTTNGRVLTISSREDAKTGSATPVVEASSPDQIPLSDQVATVIIPVHTLNPPQLIKDLDQLIPSGATVAANEAGNAVIMTAPQRDIHRFAQIIAGLDSSSVAEVRVFPLSYSDAKAVATELKDLFQSPDSSTAKSSDRQRFRGFEGPFGGGDRGGSSSDSKNSANKAVFVSDDQMNAIVASAPPDYMVGISNVIHQLDQPTQDLTMLRRFKLKYADAQETSDQLSTLFGDGTTNSDSGRSSGFHFFTPPWMQGGSSSSSSSSSQSDRMKRQAAVRVVPDLRTQSLLVSASRDMMPQIASLIEDMDHDPALVKHVYAFDIDSADPVTVQAAMQGLFGGNNTRSQNNTTVSPLGQRETSAAQQSTTTSTTSGFGSGTSGAR